MPPFFPILAIFLVFMFIGAHASSQPKKKTKTATEELAEALDKVMKASNKSEK